uniref:non-specific serine/threonine protein kinase n=1 Tax=Oryza sativa subsp. japonica TaxID=39947 RepID=Q7XMC4_ORYSJ|nr:OSJNBb0018A10.11 [Oryza sativa Japonica Group]
MVVVTGQATLQVAAGTLPRQRSDYPMANLSTLWVNNRNRLPDSITYDDGSMVRSILLLSPQTFYGPSFAAGFFCTPPCREFIFAVFIVFTSSGALFPVAVNEVIWCANRGSPLGEDATLELTGDGDLVLREKANGRLVWSSGTSGRSVQGMEITENGNLVLFDQRNGTVWQSFDHPTDALVPGQSLLQGMILKANTSPTNWTESKIYITILQDGVYGYVESTPPQLYYNYVVSTNKSKRVPTTVTFTNGCFSIFVQSTQPGNPDGRIALPEAKSIQYIRGILLENNTTSNCYLQLYCLPQSATYSLFFCPYTKQKLQTKTILVSILAAIGALILVVVVAIYVQKRRKYRERDEELDFDIMPGMPTRFSFQKLRKSTEDFSKKLGEGGFGSVYEGKISEEKVAVKRLESARQGKKEFLAEVETIGSIEHINLVRLIGVCVEKSNRLLVYEYMSRGSLDRWIYYHHNNAPLDWSTRCRIILDIAKGLCYLHEECRRKIAHLDIKPQNILLDDNFNAKLADFGLSKLIDRDQSKFGVVLMEIISGRKNIDISQPEEAVQLINLLREKAQNSQLIDMIDKHSNDMVSHQEEVIQMMKLAMWCLQNDSDRRPSMSMVVKVLEGAMRVENCLDYSFFNANSVISVQGIPSTYSAPPRASILSSPR